MARESITIAPGLRPASTTVGRSWTGKGQSAISGPDEKSDVLDERLRRQPHLRAAVEAIVMENLTTADSDAGAEAVGWDLLSMSNGRAGRQPGGYVEPTQAAWDLLEEMIATHDSRLRRLIKLGLSEPAVATAVGIGAGLYRCRGSQDSDLLVSWGPDFPLEHTLSVVQELAGAGIHRPAPLITAAPEWAGDLARVTGGDGRVTGVKNE